MGQQQRSWQGATVPSCTNAPAGPSCTASTGWRDGRGRRQGQ